MTTYAPHELHSMLTWVNDDRAVSIVTATIRMRRPFDGVLCELSSDVQLLYRTRRVNGQWYICGFDSIYEQDRLIPVLPDTKLNLESEALQNYRQSYACMSCFAEKSGIPTNQELAGRDRPETVQALYSELDRWLCREE